MFDAYYLAYKDQNKKTRFDVEGTCGTYDLFERLLLNKKEPNKGGLACYLVDQPSRWGKRAERKTDKAITKGAFNISSVRMPDPKINIGYGDVKNTQDALIFVFNKEWTAMEIFIARGQKNNSLNIYQLCIDGELEDEMNDLRSKAETRGNNNRYKTC